MDPFSTLGLAPTYQLDRDDLERRYRDMLRALHPDRFTSAPATERRMALSKAVEVNTAYRVLRDDLQRAEALVALRLGTRPADAADPELLMQIMELREGLSEANAARDLDRVRALTLRVRDAQTLAQQALSTALAAATPDPAALTRALSELKYYRRFLDEVAVIEDDALAGTPSKPEG